MAKLMPGPLPKPGQIVGCHFPRDEQPEKPGDKFRPAFVIGTDNTFGQDFHRVCVAYGTGQATSDKLAIKPLKPWQFEIDKAEGGNKLTEQTRFDCERYVWLPFTEEWFRPPTGSNVCVAVYGSVTAERTDQIRAAVEAGKEKAKPKVAPIVTTKPASKLKTANTLSLKKHQAGAGEA